MALRARLHPSSIAPLVSGEIMHDRGSARSEFGREGVGIGFQQRCVLTPRTNFVFIQGVFGKLGNEKFPQTGGSPISHGMTPTVPLIEIANDTDTTGVRSPHDKMHSGHLLYDSQVR